MNASVTGVMVSDMMSTETYPAGVDSGKILSDHTRYLFELIVYTLLCGLVSLIGITTNTINIIVFSRQGVMTDSSNTSLLGLAVADLCCLITMLWLSINYAVMLIDPSEIPWDPLSVLYITGGWPHVMFTRITCWITCFVALERCICVTFPFKVKTLFTPKRSLCVIFCIFFLIIMSYSPIFYSHRLLWMRLPDTNDTKLVLVFTQDKEKIENICHYVNDVTLPTICLTSVMVCTKITVSRINISKQWRKSVTTRSIPEKSEMTISPHHRHNFKPEVGNSKSKGQTPTDIQPVFSLSNPRTTQTKSKVKNNTKFSSNVAQKDKKVTRMVSLICIIFLLCNTPCILIIYLRFIVPEVANKGRYHNLFHVIYSIDFLLETINSTINIIVYYSMSSRYKQELHKLFCRKSCDSRD